MPKHLINPERKNQPAKKPKQFFTDTNENGKVIVRTKYSKVFQDAGQDFIKSYKVIRLKYWLKYELIGHFECAVYDTLHLFCVENIEFTLDYLAKAIGCGDATLRECLDNLENAELIEVIKITDELGQRNDYIIKSPFYDKETFTENKHIRIVKSGEDLPETYLENQVERLRRKIKKNSAKRLRTILRSKNLKGVRAEIARKAKALMEERQLLWKKLVRNLGVHAVKFDQIVWETLQINAIHKLTGNEYKARFKAILKKRLEENKIGWTHWFETIADDLRAFYESRLRFTDDAPASSRKSADHAKNDDVADGESQTRLKAEIDLLISILEDRKANTSNFTKDVIKDLAGLIGNYGKNLDLRIVNNICEDIFGDVWQKIKVEMRN